MFSRAQNSRAEMLGQRILFMLVLLTLFHPDLTESSSVCEDEKVCGCLKDRNVQIKRVYTNATAVIFCPNLEKDEELVSASLYKGEIELHSIDLRNENHQSWQKFYFVKQNYSVSYMIWWTESNDTGIYTCKIETKLGRRNNKTILLIKDAPEEYLPCPSTQTLLHYILYGVIILYNLIITVMSCYFGYKLLNRKTPENPYINTRPVRFRHR